MEQVNYTEQFNTIYSAYFNDPVGVSSMELPEVDNLLEKFPFCQSLRFIHLAGLKNQGTDFEKHLPKASLYAPERGVLYELMSRPEVVKSQKLKVKSQEPRGSKREANEEDKLILGNLAGGDFFAFERSGVDPLREAEERSPEAVPSNGEKEATVPGNTVSKYDDDQLPYTFLWWLSKTRTEHAHTYQPYSKPGSPAQQGSSNELNQQIVENVFHIKNQVDSPDYRSSSKTIQFEVKHKEDKIIDRFIREEPQIKPLPAEKIDTENKARKSSEDANDMVSETLAKIYAEQMLYEKAADTYRKLSLKFPEKRTYFADRIKELERNLYK